MQVESAGTLLVVAELETGVTELTLELLGLARRLADESGRRVGAALMGGDATAADDLIRRGADDVFWYREAAAECHGERWLASLEAIAKRAGSVCVVLGHTPCGADLAPRLAIRLKTAAAMGCVEVTAEQGKLLFTRPCHGGSLRETLSIRTVPAIATVKSGSGRAHCDPARHGVVHTMAPLEQRLRTRVIGRERESATGARLEDAKAIVAGGRGLEGPDGFDLLKELAAVLEGAVGASRVPCDLGWCPHSWQIGLTGKTVTPDLYIAVGISGASHHLAGCGRAGTIVAINTDPDAAIFKEARFGIVGDYRKVVPALTSALAAMKRESP